MSFSPEPDDGKSYEDDIIPLDKPLGYQEMVPLPDEKPPLAESTPAKTTTIEVENEPEGEPPAKKLTAMPTMPADPRLKKPLELPNSAPKNGVESQVWRDVFTVEKVATTGRLKLDIDPDLTQQRSTIRQPMKIGEYSLTIDSQTGERDFKNDATELKYLHVPPKNASLDFDLCHGYDASIIWGEKKDVRLDELLQWIMLNKKKFVAAGQTRASEDLNTDFITYRGVLTKVMTAPYENMEKWLICATKWRNTIYMCEFVLEKFPAPDDYFNRLSFGGYRFEKYVTSPDPNVPIDPNMILLDNNQYCCVMRSRVFDQQSSHSFVVGAEVDAAIPHFNPRTATLENFVEIKTTKKISTEFQYRSFRQHKLLKWWAQSYLVGVPRIYCGYRDTKLVVRDAEFLSIDSFPGFGEQFWSPNVCLNFMNRFMSFVKENVTIDDPHVVYQFLFTPHQDIICKRLAEPGHYQILPDWYIRDS